MQTSTEDWLYPQCLSRSGFSGVSGVLVGEVEEDEESIPAPPFSPISELGDEEASGDSTSEASDTEQSGDESRPELSPEPLPSDIPAHSSQSGLLENWHGYKLVGDNIDKDVRASYQRLHHTTQSFHYFHAYAMLDRVDFSGLSDVSPPQSAVDPLSLLPSDSDLALLKRDMSILISR